MAYGKTMKGVFKPRHPEKYVGNSKNIIYRSSWEFSFLKLLDESENVLAYSSEELAIPYWNPVKGTKARYFPDMLIKQKNKDGSISKILIEIKPMHEIHKPERRKNQKMQTYLEALALWTVNQAKWKAATKWCAEHDCRFVVVTKDSNEKFALLTETQLGL